LLALCLLLALLVLDYAIKGIKDDDLNAKEGLLLWCRKKTAGYHHVDPPTITNFTGVRNDTGGAAGKLGWHPE
jgi:hypothetical protein